MHGFTFGKTMSLPNWESDITTKACFFIQDNQQTDKQTIASGHLTHLLAKSRAFGTTAEFCPREGTLRVRSTIIKLTNCRTAENPFRNNKSFSNVSALRDGMRVYLGRVLRNKKKTGLFINVRFFSKSFQAPRSTFKVRCKSKESRRHVLEPFLHRHRKRFPPPDDLRTESGVDGSL